MTLDAPRYLAAACLLLAGLTSAPACAQPRSRAAALPAEVAAGACAFVVTLSQAPGPNTVVQVDLKRRPYLRRLRPRRRLSRWR